MIMRIHVALLIFAAFVAFPRANVAANEVASTSVGAQKNSRITLPFKTTPTFSSAGSPARSRLFPVRDEKGLLLTCIAPQIDKNPDTDIFNDCVLAPGRTLDDVMHAFVSAIHYEHNQRPKEQTKKGTEPETVPDQTTEQK
jgi:hypothetical protein